MNILVVDDKSVILQELTDLLMKNGVFVETANNGLSASGKLLNSDFDLFIIDHLMPLMDGVKLVHNMKKQPDLANVPIIFMTTKSLGEAQQALAHVTVEHILTKPLNLEQLQAIIAAYQIENTRGVSL